MCSYLRRGQRYRIHGDIRDGASEIETVRLGRALAVGMPEVQVPGALEVVASDPPVTGVRLRGRGRIGADQLVVDVQRHACRADRGDHVMPSAVVVDPG